MFVSVPFLGSLTILPSLAPPSGRPFVVERVDPGDGGREYLLAGGRWEIYLTTGAAIRAERRRCSSGLRVDELRFR